MKRALLVLAAACGGNGTDDAPIQDKLEALPGVTLTVGATDNDGYEYFVLAFEQPVDHTNPDGPKFQQRVALMHADEALPMVALTSGYWDYYGDRLYELTRVLGANQISIEHRFFGDSRPDPADWSKLTIEQMANDQHRIIQALRTIYGGAFVTTGGSKGGMTAVFHRRFFPDDVEGTVPYVAPISFGAPDLRYAPFLDTLGPAACRQAVRDLALELLRDRRAMVTAKAQEQATKNGYTYTRIALDPAVESAIASLEWAFWQYAGVTSCPRVPAVTDSDNAMWTFLDIVSPVSDNADHRIGEFEAYYHQAYAQLGFPDAGAAYLDPHLVYTDADYLRALPTEMPAYDGGAAMRDIDQFVQERGNRLLFVYGEWDPWTAGPFRLGNATESALFVQPEGAHNARLSRLATPDRDAAFAMLAAWTGVTPEPLPTTFRSAPEPEPRIPSGLLRALRAR